MANEVKERNGVFVSHPERRAKSPVVGKQGRPDKPEIVRDNDVASAKWDELCGLLEHSGIMSRTDGDLIECYCITFAMYRKALLDVNKTGQVLVRKRGDGVAEVKRSPFSVELHKYMDRLNKLQAELGLTPSSRSRLSLGDGEQEVDPMVEFLKRRERN